MSRAHPLSNIKSPESLRLGCLVINTDDIHQDIHDPFPSRPAENEVDISTFGGYQDTQTLSKNSKLRSLLLDLFSISRERQSKNESTLTAPQFTHHHLRNQTDWFLAVCGEEETRKWLVKAVNSRHDVYLLVGFLVLQDAKLAIRNTFGTSSSEGAAVPALPPGFAVFNNTITPEIRATRDVTSTRDSQFDAPGKRIFGVWYRKVKFEWFFSRKVDDLFLSRSTRWRPFWEWRGPDEEVDQDEEEEDVIEASLEDEDEDNDNVGSDAKDGQEDVLDTVSTEE